MTSPTIVKILKHSSLNKLISPRRVLGGRPVTVLTQQRQSSSCIKPNHKVLYDGNCPICVKEVDLLQRINSGSVKFVDITKGKYNPSDHQGIQYADAMGALHVISPDKKLFIGMDGTRELYRALGFGWLVAFTEIPGVKSVADNAYRWFALNRYWLTGRLGENKDDDCDSGRCKITNNGQRKR